MPSTMPQEILPGTTTTTNLIYVINAIYSTLSKLRADKNFIPKGGVAAKLYLSQKSALETGRRIFYRISRTPRPKSMASQRLERRFLL